MGERQVAVTRATARSGLDSPAIFRRFPPAPATPRQPAQAVPNPLSLFLSLSFFRL